MISHLKKQQLGRVAKKNTETAPLARCKFNHSSQPLNCVKTHSNSKKWIAKQTKTQVFQEGMQPILIELQNSYIHVMNLRATQLFRPTHGLRVPYVGLIVLPVNSLVGFVGQEDYQTSEID